jgi:hypothetical protein
MPSDRPIHPARKARNLDTLLFWSGVGTFLIATVVCTTLQLHEARSVLLGPLAVLLLGVFAAPTWFMIGFITGTPGASLTYGAKAVWRHKAGVIGVVLLLGVAAGIARVLF